MVITLEQIFFLLALAVGTFVALSTPISRQRSQTPEDLRETGIRLQLEAVAIVQGLLHKCAIIQSEVGDSAGERREKLIALMPLCEVLQATQVEKQRDPELRRSMLTELSRRHDALVKEYAKDLMRR